VKYLLDTNICVELIRRKPPRLIRRLLEHEISDVGISAITSSELAYGVAHSSNPEQNQLALEEFLAPLEVVEYQADVAPVYGRIRAHLRRIGQPIGPLDMLIGAHAVYLGTVLVTANEDEFSRVPHLVIENWVA
jgi:tRNA(fMet)-specific endonuclease VapC